MYTRLSRMVIFLLAAAALLSGCQGWLNPDNRKYDKVMLLYSAGYNSLSSFLLDDIDDMKSGYIPGVKDKDILLIAGQHTSSSYDYTTPSAAHLVRIYKDRKGLTVSDTLKTYSEEVDLSQATYFRKVLTDVSDLYESDHYGMIFSSHSTGWLPKGYYSNPSAYDKAAAGTSGVKRAAGISTVPSGAVPYVEEERMPGEPAVKSLGARTDDSSGTRYSYEIDLDDFSSALPMHFDYIIFDACLAGGIEVAYQLRDKCDVISFSQTEVLAEGLNYKLITSHLLEGEPDVEAVATDYYEQYAAEAIVSDRSATVSVIDCSALADLQSICKTLFSSYREQIAALRPSSVQRYYRSSHHWFYDLEDILVQAGISDAEKHKLESALDKCIIYKAATEAFLEAWGGFKIENYSGFSMYLPCNGSAYLDTYYKTLDWNKATGLVY